MRSPRLSVTPREAAALHRLLDAYVVTEGSDPGMPDLRTFKAKVEQVEQDHSAYDTAFGVMPQGPDNT